MKETTVGDLIDLWPGCEVSDLNYGKFKAKFRDDRPYDIYPREIEEVSTKILQSSERCKKQNFLKQ
jgi:hypothetical protein